jgi:hypothetical protein
MRRAMPHLSIGGLGLVVASCLPFPAQGPRVEQGLSVGGGLALRDIERLAPDEKGPPTDRWILPEATATASAGFAREDGTGPAARIGATIGFPGPWSGDAYVKLPNAGPLVGGIGALFGSLGSSSSPTWRASSAFPYGTLGWQRGDGKTIYGSVTLLSSHRRDAPDSSVRGEAIVVGLQDRRALEFGNGSLTRRAFIALFHGNRRMESAPAFDGSVPQRSVVVIGISADIAKPWRRFNQPVRRPYPR